MSHVCKRIFKIQALIKQLLTKYQIFTILPQISHFHKCHNFFKYFCNFLDQLLHPYKFHGRDMSGILFFIFASCHPLRMQHQNERWGLNPRPWIQCSNHCALYKIFFFFFFCKPWRTLCILSALWSVTFIQPVSKTKISKKSAQIAIIFN